jgi:hypothetical protein
MPQTSIPYGNLSLVPVLRHRLEFAILVRRALAELGAKMPWDKGQDLIVVTLPPSMEASLDEAIQGLPNVSLVVAKAAGRRDREVFGVTPADAFVEAVRTAREHEWPVEFADIAPSVGNLLGHDLCVRDPGWPDDSLVHHMGAGRYLRLVEGYFAVPPARIEPLDTWREVAVSEHLRTVQPFWRRVLVVCDAGLVGPVIDRLGQPAVGRAAGMVPDARMRLDVSRNLSLQVLLAYLDDYPRIVESYESSRWAGDRFSKRDTLLEAVHEQAMAAQDLRTSTRQHETFAAFLNNLLLLERRICPTPDVLEAAAAGCFGRAFAERLACHFAGYGRQIKVDVERVVTESTAVKQLEVATVAYSAKTRIFRTVCDPFSPAYSVLPPPADKDRAEPKSGEVSYSWDKPQLDVLSRLHDRLPRLAMESQRMRTALPYHGSVECGIDVRRTIRSLYQNQRTLYVKVDRREDWESKVRDEPAVWIFREEPEDYGTFGSYPIAYGQDVGLAALTRESFAIGSINVTPKYPRVGSNVQLLLTTEKGAQVQRHDTFAWITFGSRFDSKEAARAHFGELFPKRFPDHGEFEHPCGCVHRDLLGLAEGGLGWAVVAILTALKYADRSIMLIAPTTFIVPPHVGQHPLAAGKSIHRIPLHRFSRSERELIGSIYGYWIPDGANDPEVKSAFRIIMRRYWK